MRKPRLCSDCGTRTEWKTIGQKYERGGVRVRLARLPAMVYPRCEGVSLDADTTDHIMECANAMFKIVEDRHKAAVSAAVV